MCSHELAFRTGPLCRGWTRRRRSPARAHRSSNGGQGASVRHHDGWLSGRSPSGARPDTTPGCTLVLDGVLPAWNSPSMCHARGSACGRAGRRHSGLAFVWTQEAGAVSSSSACSRAAARPTQPLNERSAPHSSRAIPWIGSLVGSTSRVTVRVRRLSTGTRRSISSSRHLVVRDRPSSFSELDYSANDAAGPVAEVPAARSAAGIASREWIPSFW